MEEEVLKSPALVLPLDSYSNKIVLPIYKDQRLADISAFTPFKGKLTKSQEDPAGFILHVMCH